MDYLATMPAPKHHKKLHVFISYSRQDTELAQQIHDDIENAGLDAWMDTRDINAGYEWDDSIEDAISDCDYLVLVLSENSRMSRNVKNEYSLALDLDKKIIPILKEQCKVPLSLQRIQHIDFEYNYSDGLQQLLEALHNESLKPVTPPPSSQHLTDNELNSLLQRKQILFYGGLVATAIGSSLLLSTAHILSAISLCALLAVLIFWLLETGSPNGKQLSSIQRKKITGYRGFFLPSRLTRNG